MSTHLYALGLWILLSLWLIAKGLKEKIPSNHPEHKEVPTGEQERPYPGLTPHKYTPPRKKWARIPDAEIRRKHWGEQHEVTN